VFVTQARPLFSEHQEVGLENPEHLPIFLSDVKARRDKMVGLVETMLKLYGQTADGLRLTAYGQGENAVHFHISERCQGAA
jgi:hypothetical protein